MIHGIPAWGKEPLSPRLLPNSLTVFETVARLESVSAAALTLNIAASAISRHITNLETRLSLELFIRKGNRLTLTPDGHDLAQAVRDGLGLIQHRVADMQLKRSGVVLLGCSVDMAAFWVMPRYERIASLLDMRNFRMITANDYSEFDQPSVDISIRLGAPENWPGYEAIRLFGRNVILICAPSLLEKHPGLKEGSSEQLMEVPLIHYGLDDDGIGSWRDWFGVSGRRLPGPHFSNFQTILHATIRGHGVAMAIPDLVEEQLRTGEIVQLGEAREMPEAYYIVLRLPERPAARALAKLLLE